MTTARRTQQERRTETRQRVLEAACLCFGEKGYAQTSLEDIAAACGQTIRPIYHYFGNKKNLFAAVTECLELELVNALEASLTKARGQLSQKGWETFLDMSANKQFRQVVLVDAPLILGRERWASSSVVMKVRGILLGMRPGTDPIKAELATRMLIAALAEAALMTTETENSRELMLGVGDVIESILKQLAN